MRAVNLLPRDVGRTRDEGARAPLLLVAGGIAALTAAAVVLSLSASGATDERRAELAATEAAIALLPTTPRPAVTQGALVQERTDRVAALAAALSTRISFDRLLRELSFVLPEDAWLTGITAAAPASFAPVGAIPGAVPPPSPFGTDGVTIEGATYSHDSVARVLSRLSVVPSLENVRLTASARLEPQQDEKKKARGTTVVTFTVTAALRTGSPS